mgnify:FL=1
MYKRQVASVNKNLPDGAKLKQTVAEIQLHVNAALAKAERALEKIENAVSSAPEWKTTQQQLLDAAKVMEETADALNQWADGVEPSAPLAAKEARQLASQCSALAAKLRTVADSPDIAALAADCDALVAAIRAGVGRLPVTAESLRKQLDAVTGEVADTVKGVGTLATDAQALKDAADSAADALGETVELLRPATKRMISSLENAIDELQGLSDDEYMDTLVDILGGDPAVYGQYFPEMVQTLSLIHI